MGLDLDRCQSYAWIMRRSLLLVLLGVLIGGTVGAGAESFASTSAKVSTGKFYACVAPDGTVDGSTITRGVLPTCVVGDKTTDWPSQAPSVARIQSFVVNNSPGHWSMYWDGAVLGSNCAPDFPLYNPKGAVDGCSFVVPVGAPIDLAVGGSNASGYAWSTPCKQPEPNGDSCVFTATADTNVTVIVSP
jgi:hypothetical protein